MEASKSHSKWSTCDAKYASFPQITEDDLRALTI
ncbi:unnamed protein product, partial [Didymodactylos carnosus]